MTTFVTLDLARVLAPLAGADPAGPSLRYDPDYDRVREARRQDDQTLPQGVWKTQPKRADWDEAIRLCLNLLESRSKDIQIGCWLLEALVHRYGFAGLAPGIEVVLGLCRTFWDGLHPRIENGDLSDRIAPLEWLNAKLPTVLNQLPVTRSDGRKIESYSLTDYRNAQRLSLAAARDQKVAATAEARQQILLPVFEASAAATPVAFHRALHEQIVAALHATEELNALLDARCGAQSPSLVTFHQTLMEMLGWVDTILRSKGEEPAMIGEPPMGADTGLELDPPVVEEDGNYSLSQFADPIRSREEAYYRLAEVADYLFRTEPHSPTPYLIQRAVSWGNLPLHELLLELSRGRNDLSTIFDLLGMNINDLAGKGANR